MILSAAPVSDSHRCLNCGAALTGAYCAACGQSAHLHRSLLHLVEEILHGVAHFDAKGWRTLPLLALRPGELTRRYIEGERVRFVSPLALFLFCSFLLYAVLSLTGHAPHGAPLVAAQRAEVDRALRETLGEQQAAVDAARAALERAKATGDREEIATASGELRAAQLALAASRKANSVVSLTLGAVPTVASPAAAATGAGAEGGAPPVLSSQLSQLEVHTGSAWLDGRVRRVLQNPELFLYKLKTTAYKWSFMLIPISLPLIWLMFIGRRDIALYEHAVFSLYSLSFMAVLITLTVIVASLGLEAPIPVIMGVVPPVHMYRQLRGTYGLTRLGAAWRTLALLAIAGSAFLVFLGAVAALAA